jgi:hypothetical protein
MLTWQLLTAMASLNQGSEMTRPTIAIAESKSARRVDHKDVLSDRLVNEAVAIPTTLFFITGQYSALTAEALMRCVLTYDCTAICQKKANYDPPRLALFTLIQIPEAILHLVTSTLNALPRLRLCP